MKILGKITGTTTLEGTASYAISASYALNAANSQGGSYFGSGGIGSSYTSSFSIQDWNGPTNGYYLLSFIHNLNSENIFVSLWDETSQKSEIFPDSIIQDSPNQVSVFVSSVPDGRFSGSIIISPGTGNSLITGSFILANQTSSMSVLSSSYASTASYVENASISTVSASFSETASYAFTASYVKNASIDTSQFVLNSYTSSMSVLSSSYASTASYAKNASFDTSSFVINSYTSSMKVLSSSYASTASYVGNTSFDTSSFATLYSNIFHGNQTIISSGSTILLISGSQGTLFSIIDTTSSVFSANNVSGLPVIEAFSDNTVKIGKYGSEQLIVSGSGITYISGRLIISNSSAVPESISSSGLFGEIRFNSNYLYIATGSNAWKRIQLVNW